MITSSYLWKSNRPKPYACNSSNLHAFCFSQKLVFYSRGCVSISLIHSASNIMLHVSLFPSGVAGVQVAELRRGRRGRCALMFGAGSLSSRWPQGPRAGALTTIGEGRGQKRSLKSNKIKQTKQIKQHKQTKTKQNNSPPFPQNLPAAAKGARSGEQRGVWFSAGRKCGGEDAQTDLLSGVFVKLFQAFLAV